MRVETKGLTSCLIFYILSFSCWKEKFKIRAEQLTSWILKLLCYPFIHVKDRFEGIIQIVFFPIRTSEWRWQISELAVVESHDLEVLVYEITTLTTRTRV